MNYGDLRERRYKLLQAEQQIQDQADLDNRSLTPGEAARSKALLDEAEDIGRQIKEMEIADPIHNRTGRISSPSMPDSSLSRYAASGPKEGLFNGPLNFADFGKCVKEAAFIGGRVDPRLVLNVPSTYSAEGVGADGGYAVPPEISRSIWEKVEAEDSLVKLTDSYSTTSNSMLWPADETTPWDATGGIQAYWEGEASQLQASKVALQNREIKLDKLTILVPVTSELMEDYPALDAYLNKKAAEKIDFKIKQKMLTGSGVGEPLGILNAASTITVAKETNQAASTIVAENVINMYARMYAPCRKTAVWLINQDIEPQLDQLMLRVKNQAGTDYVGGAIPLLYMPSGGLSGSPYNTLRNRPCLPTQACSALGDVGDIIFVDFKQYLTVTKRTGIQSDVSMHLFFDYDLFCFRFLLRFAGQPWWKDVIQPASDGANTLTWAVALAQRS